MHKEGEFAPSYWVTLAGDIGALCSSSSHRALIFMRYHLQEQTQSRSEMQKEIIEFHWVCMMDKVCGTRTFV
jgi:hypothetical protein